MSKSAVFSPQVTIGKKTTSLTALPQTFPDTLSWWREQFFALYVTTAPASQQKQWRHIETFIQFMREQNGEERRALWTPRLSRDFFQALKIKPDGTPRATDTINNGLNHVRAFAKWIHHIKPFPLGDPMLKVKNVRSIRHWGSRALKPAERNRLLDAADYLPLSWGKSKDRHRYGVDPKQRPMRKTARPYRNRAIIYTLIETGMRRAAITHIEVDSVHFDEGIIEVIEKGDLEASYTITKAGLRAIADYLKHERPRDAESWGSPLLFLPAKQKTQSSGRLTPLNVNVIWNQIARLAQLPKGRTPHSARHAVGVDIMKKTKNPKAVAAQLNHVSVTSSLSYMGVSKNELREIMESRHDGGVRPKDTVGEEG